MGRNERVFGWTYEDLSAVTGITVYGLMQRVSRGLDLDDVFVFARFILENKRKEGY